MRSLPQLTLPASLEEEYRVAFHDLAKRRGMTETTLLETLMRETRCPKLSAAQLRVILLNEARDNLPAHHISLRENGPERASFELESGLVALEKMGKK